MNTVSLEVHQVQVRYSHHVSEINQTNTSSVAHEFPLVHSLRTQLRCLLLTEVVDWTSAFHATTSHVNTT